MPVTVLSRISSSCMMAEISMLLESFLFTYEEMLLLSLGLPFCWFILRPLKYNLAIPSVKIMGPEN